MGDHQFSYTTLLKIKSLVVWCIPYYASYGAHTKSPYGSDVRDGNWQGVIVLASCANKCKLKGISVFFLKIWFCKSGEISLKNQVFHENILQKNCHQNQEVFFNSSKLLLNIINKDMDTNKTSIITASKKTATKLNNVKTMCNLRYIIPQFLVFQQIKSNKFLWEHQALSSCNRFRILSCSYMGSC